MTSEELLLITEESEVHLVRDETTWVLDSGVSYHLTPHRKCFSSYNAGVKMENEGVCRIVVIGGVVDSVNRVQTAIESSMSHSGSQTESDVNDKTTWVVNSGAS